MLIYDVLHKEKVYQIVSGNLRTMGVKYRIKKNCVKAEKPERLNSGALKKVFRTSLSYLPLDVVNLSSGGIVHVPLFVSQATAFLLKHVSQEGLFRKAGSQIKQKEIIARLDNGGGLGDKNNPIDVANCLKTFFRHLPEPLIPYNYHDLFVRCNLLKKNKVEALLLACIILPPHHLNSLAYLMEFLKTVASYEKQNKMSIDNLARVVGPNVMPLQETTMIAVQSRLEAHLTVVKLLIENAEKIGVLPNDISDAISMDTAGSTENELDHSDISSSFKSKRKKHRSGSLTRMLSGLKKMVGKNNTTEDADTQESNLLPVESALHVYTPLKLGKRKKVDADLVKRNPLKEKSPNQKNGIQKYTSNRVLEPKISEKIERPKRLRLSLDRFVPKGKHKISERDTESHVKSFSPSTVRRWSGTSNTLDHKQKRRRTHSIGSPFSSSPKTKVRNSNTIKSSEEVSMNADVNLSDEILREISGGETKIEPFRRNSVSRIPTHSYSLRNSFSPNTSDAFKVVNNTSKEYVKIPKSEYEEIKNRMSAIESCISQEFKSIDNQNSEALTANTINQVQSEYEKTLVEASIESTTSTDQLAKRLSRELKIRRSAEHKIIRSPSARKIGTLRRRSQEKPPSKKVHRAISWNIYDRPPIQNHALQADSRLNNTYVHPKQCNLKRGRPLVKRDSYKSLDQTPKNEHAHPTSFCSDETNARLNYLQEQLNALISHTAEHTKGSFSDDDFTSLDEDTFTSSAKSTTSSGKPTINSTIIRRASSFQGEFIDNSQYYNNKIKELKKTSSHQNLGTESTENLQSIMKSTEPKREKTVTWKDADKYFKQEVKMMTPIPTGRASVAKLRALNAGMVLAKAKLFDDPKKEAVDVNRRQSVKVQVTAQATAKNEQQRTPRNKRVNNVGDAVIRRKNINSANRRSQNTESPLIKMELTISSGSRRQSARFSSPRMNHDETVIFKENQDITIPNPKQSKDVSFYQPNESPLCRTPHIKKPLTVKTPKSAKSLSARRLTISSRRTPMKAVLPITPKRQSPRIVMKSNHISRH
ncbi:rho GTPase-activating protein 24 isoform X2 [Copidosoma floridanum]|uniref:rho GTPase-activating protein 24 isoform X2 n=1 Tax=Copidosoma floridanum TaxID=29053 RepID=UPI0006C9458D|nr:rho GTPase-activating protein 24 isoform X2 [Copidosoma floridanum]